MNRLLFEQDWQYVSEYSRLYLFQLEPWLNCWTPQPTTKEVKALIKTLVQFLNFLIYKSPIKKLFLRNVGAHRSKQSSTILYYHNLLDTYSRSDR